MINREKCRFGAVRIDIYRRSFGTSTLDLVKMLSLTIEAELNGNIVNVDAKLRSGVIGEVVDFLHGAS